MTPHSPPVLRGTLAKSAPLLALGLALAGAGPTSAAVVPYDLAGLAKRSDLIASGTVVGMESYWAPFEDVGDVIYTDVRIRIDRLLEGKPESDEVTLTVLGGTVGTRTMVCADSARYGMGERVLVFLRERDGRLWNVGWHQGKYRVAPDGVTVRGRRDLPIAEDTDVEVLRTRIAAHRAASPVPAGLAPPTRSPASPAVSAPPKAQAADAEGGAR